MFTGIVKDVGKVKSISKASSYWRFGIETFLKDLKPSLSVSVNGVCLTVVEQKQNLVYFDAIKPTLDITNLKYLKVSDEVNLEDALSLGDKLDGHFVLGHIDCISKVVKIIKKGEFYLLDIKRGKDFDNYLFNKCSIAINGVSLTVYSVGSSCFTVNIIPYTFSHTNLKSLRPSSSVNIEFDYLLKSFVSYSSQGLGRLKSK